MPVNVRELVPRVPLHANSVGCRADVASAGQSTARNGWLALQPPIVRLVASNSSLKHLVRTETSTRLEPHLGRRFVALGK